MLAPQFLDPAPRYPDLLGLGRMVRELGRLTRLGVAGRDVAQDIVGRRLAVRSDERVGGVDRLGVRLDLLRDRTAAGRIRPVVVEHRAARRCRLDLMREERLVVRARFGRVLLKEVPRQVRPALRRLVVVQRQRVRLRGIDEERFREALTEFGLLVRHRSGLERVGRAGQEALLPLVLILDLGERRTPIAALGRRVVLVDGEAVAGERFLADDEGVDDAERLGGVGFEEFALPDERVRRLG